MGSKLKTPPSAPPPTRRTRGAARSSNAFTELRAAATALLDRMQFAEQAGLTYDASGVAKRDMYKALGYKRTLYIKDYRDRYSRGGIAARLVDAYPNATWAPGTELVEDDNPDVETDFERDWHSFATRLNIWSVLRRVHILASLGRWGVIVIGTAGNADLSTELPRGTGPDDVIYLTPLAEDRALINEFEADTTNERFGLPQFYNINFGINIEGFGVGPRAGQQVRVHWSRCIHVALGLLDNEVYGEPFLRRGWNLLDDLDKCVGGGAEATWKNVAPGMHLDIDPALKAPPVEIQAIKDQLEDFEHGLSRQMTTRGTKLNMLQAAVKDIEPNAAFIVRLLGGTYGVPYRLLTGSEQGRLAATQDRDNWDDRKAELKSSFAEPLVGTLVDRLIDYGYLPKPAAFSVSWPQEEEMSEAEKAVVAAGIALANANQMKSSKKPIMTSDEIRDKYLGLGALPNLSPDEQPPDVALPDALGVPAPDAAGVPVPPAAGNGNGTQPPAFVARAQVGFEAAQVQPQVGRAAYNPDQPRDPDGKWSDGGSGGTAFHGTNSEHLQSILAQGIKPGQFSHVFMSTSRAVAEQYAEYTHLGRPVLLKVAIPASAAKDVTKLEHPPTVTGKEKSVITYRGTIKPEWIKAVYVHSPLAGWEKMKSAVAADDKVTDVWIVVDLLSATETGTTEPHPLLTITDDNK